MGLGVQAYQMGGLGIFRYPSMISPDGDIKLAIYSMVLDVVALVVGFGLAWMIGFNDDEPTVALNKEEAKNKLVDKVKKLVKKKLSHL